MHSLRLYCLIIIIFLLTSVLFGTPLSGTFDLGGGNNDFASFAEAASALSNNGVSGLTVINVYSGIYQESVHFFPVSGTSNESRVIFQKADQGSVRIQSSSSPDSSIVTLSGACYVTFDGIDISGLGSSVFCCLRVEQGGHDNVFTNGIYSGSSATSSLSDVINVRGAQNNYNRFTGLQISTAFDGFHLDGVSASAQGNVIDSCHIYGVRRGIFAARQDNCSIHANDIETNAGSSAEIDGIYISTTFPTATNYIFANKIHNSVTSGSYAVGIRIKTDSTFAVTKVFNNFIYDFRNTSSSQARGIWINSGTLEIFSNSILINDVTATGNTYDIYVNSGSSSGTITVKNNILANIESTNNSYNLFFVSNAAVFTSDYNIFNGTGSNYKLAYKGMDLPLLNQWKAATGNDAHGLTGDPGFLNATDLHLSPSNGLAHQNGITIPSIMTDIDDEDRLSPPDRGADEYSFLAPEKDFAVIEFVGIENNYSVATNVPVEVNIQNRGSAAQIDVPVRLYFDNVIQDERFVSLDALETIHQTFNWATGDSVRSGVLWVQSFLVDDAFPSNDSIATLISIEPLPLAGNLNVGSGSGSYPSISAAIEDLAAKGISAPVIITISGTVYQEQITIPNIPGASEQNTITIQGESSRANPTLISSNTPPATIVMDGANYITIEGLSIEAELPNAVCCQLTNNSDYNTISNCSVTGSSLLQNTCIGISTFGGGNDNNTFRRLSLNGSYYGIRLEGASSLSDSGNTVDSCTIINTHTSIRTDYQNYSRIRKNSIHIGYSGETTACYGVYLATQNSGKPVIIEANELTGGQSTATSIGIYCATGTGIANIWNNFIFNRSGNETGGYSGVTIASGTANVYFNSLYLNDIPGTGELTAFAVSGTGTEVNIKNNVILNAEQQNSAICISLADGTLHSDYNAFYNATANSLFRIGRDGTSEYSLLSAWKSGTMQDMNSLYGNPGFRNPLDLHIELQNPLLNRSASYISEVNRDFDGEPRRPTPDIGADEYEYGTLANDYAVNWLAQPDSIYSAGSINALPIVVRNMGSQNQIGVPIRLFLDNRMESEALISLEAGSSDTVSLSFLAPDTGLAYYVLRIQSFLSGDQNTANDSTATKIVIAGPPLSGVYNIGGELSNFPSFSYAANSLRLRGIDGPVFMEVTSGEYPEAVEFSATPGASSINRVTCRASDMSGNTVTISNDSASAVVTLNNASYLTFEGITIDAAAYSKTCILLKNGSCHNEFRNLNIAGPDSTDAAAIGIQIELDSNNSNSMENLTISGVYTGIILSDNTHNSSRCSENRIQGCTIRNPRYGIYVENQTSCEIAGNDIQPGSNSTLAAACYGIYLFNLGEGGYAEIYNNQIHHFADQSSSTTNRAVGVYCVGGNGATVKVYNNFIYDFSNIRSLKISGIYLSIGNNLIYHNSVLLEDISTTPAEIAGIYISSGNSHNLMNNIIQSQEDDIASYGIINSSGSELYSNYNDIYGSASSFAVCRVQTTNYATLAAWQATGHDLQSISVNPNFISATDLHIRLTSNNVNGRGSLLDSILADIDGNVRSNPPDIGADEYNYLSLPDTIQSLTILYSGDSIRLDWQPVPGAFRYMIYADQATDFPTSAENRIATTTQTYYIDPQFGLYAKRFYVIVADANP